MVVLRINKKNFDLIASGIKKSEWRQYSKYNINLLFKDRGDGKKDGNNEIKQIKFINGYSCDAPFLTKEDIEKEGWVYDGKSIDLWFYKEGEFERTSYTVCKVTLHYNLEDRWLFIYLKDTGEDVLIFQGKCRCINDFRTVCKLLNI